MENVTLKTILEQHTLWLDSNEKEGKRANLSGANLSGANLSGANLTCADLTRADLTFADLTSANLTGADLTDVDLSHAHLTSANLSGANLTHAELRYANLSDANLSGVDLTGVDLRCANLTDANLTDANLTDADLERANLTDTIIDEKEQCRKGIVLTESMIGYKNSNEGKIITLEIPIGAKVFSINNSKRRTNKAKVIDMQGETELSSIHDIDFKYHVGDEIEITNFDKNYNVECGAGIHFFLTGEEAENYEY